jgi:serine/threonine-protein kinase
LHPDLGAALGAERFLSEIKTTAKLQHPHILPLLDSGAADGLLYYVMPYVRGETLRARLERETQLPIGDALRIAMEVADALQAAHALGVVHRDIKPENILLQDGHALVADFGIALAVQTAGGQRMTQTGLSLGTPQYMSPEQATGEKVVDARSDIYALAAVTYEMLTGAPPFTGASMQAIIARVVTSDAEPPSRVRKTIPATVDAAVLQGLAKLPADRFATARDFAAALRGDSAGAGRPPATAGRGGGRRTGWLVAAAALVATAAGGWAAGRATETGTTALPTLRHRVVLWKTAVPLPTQPGAQFISRQMAISADGEVIVFADSTDRGWSLFRKRRADEEPVPVPGSEGGRSPFLSPDGRWIGYFLADGGLYKVGIDGGTSVRMTAGATNRFYYTAAWLADNSVVFTSGDSGGVFRVSASGGPAKALRVPKEWGGQLTHVEALPDSRAVLLVACESNCAVSSNAYWYDLTTDSMHLAIPDVVGIWYHPPSGLLLVSPRDGGLFAAPFDLKRGRLTADLKPVLDRVAPGQFAMSSGGDVLYAPMTSATSSRALLWVDRQGRPTPVDSGWHGLFEYPAVSPDGQRLGVSLSGASTVLWLREADGSRSPVRTANRVAWRPSWSPNGQRLLFIGTLDSAGPRNAIFETDAAGRTVPRILSDRSPSTGNIWEAEVCNDGTLAFRSDDPTGLANVWAVVPGDTTFRSVARSPAQDIQVAVSPDCRTIAYMSNESGQANVFIANFPQGGTRRLVSRDGGTEPRWSKDGRVLYYVGQGQLMQVPMGSDPLRTMGDPSALFRLDGYVRARNRAQFDVAPDGRFLMIKEPPAPPVPPVVYVQNWIPELLARMKQ